MDKISFDEARYIGPQDPKYHSRIAPARMVRQIMQDFTTPRQQQMLLLYFYQQKKMTEIAAMLGVNKSTVSRTVKRGLSRVQRQLRFYMEQENGR